MAKVSEAHCDSGKQPAFSGKTTAFDAPASVEHTDALSTQASAPQLTNEAAPAAGFKIARVRVNARVLTNGVFAVHPESFVLVDADGDRCGQPATNGLTDALRVSQVDEATPAAGSVAFVVPAEANLSDYTVYYLGQPGTNDAVAAWSGAGVAPVVDQLTTCTDSKSGYSLKGVPDHPFGAAVTTGDSQVSLDITAATPAMRELPPGPDQPNDVSGLAITIQAKATGSEGFIERNQFQLLDSTGHLCQYNELGSVGETLTSALVPVGSPKFYTVIFWVPRGAQIPGWKMLYVPDPTANKVTATWTSAASKVSTAATSPSSTTSLSTKK
ncbi:hypothetical protein GCM10027579_20560 [Calidifontibacter terrae]